MQEAKTLQEKVVSKSCDLYLLLRLFMLYSV
jgi:hypothetical protein